MGYLFSYLLVALSFFCWMFFFFCLFWFVLCLNIPSVLWKSVHIYWLKRGVCQTWVLARWIWPLRAGGSWRRLSRMDRASKHQCLEPGSTIYKLWDHGQVCFTCLCPRLFLCKMLTSYMIEISWEYICSMHWMIWSYYHSYYYYHLYHVVLLC